MGWEDRNGRSYYYRKEREDGRVRSVYVGAGETAALVARLDALRAEEREEERSAEHAERERQQQQDAQLDALAALCRLYTKGALVAAGFHTHRRQWRRLRGTAHGDGSEGE